jgi:hypothetical protein
MSSRARHVFFRHHWWLIPTIGTTAALLVFKSPVSDKATVFATIVASILSISFFVQQQRLAEMNLFRELITSFNTRYDQLNDRLMRMRHEEDGSDYQAVWDYFNLCAEEFLFYSEGYIHPRVWRSWCIGMLYYFEAEPFAEMWNNDEAPESYYGLTLEAIRKGAELKA